MSTRSKFLKNVKMCQHCSRLHEEAKDSSRSPVNRRQAAIVVRSSFATYKSGESVVSVGIVKVRLVFMFCSVVDLAGTRSDVDAKPYTTLMYAVGPGYVQSTHGRENLTSAPTSKTFAQWPAVPHILGVNHRPWL